MNFTQRSLYFIVGLVLGTIVVIFIGIKKNVQFPYGPDARTLKSIRIKPHRIFSEQAQKTIEKHQLDSIKIDNLLTEGDVDFSKSNTDTSIPCQTYQIEGLVDQLEVSMLVKRCDSSASFEKIVVNPISITEN